MQKSAGRLKMIFFVSAVLCLAALLYALIPSRPSNPSKVKSIGTDKSEMFDDLFRNGGFIVYGASEAALAKRYAEDSERLRSHFKWAKFKVLPDTAVDESDLQRSALILLGTYNSNRIIRKLSGKFPVKISSGSIAFMGLDYKDSTTVLNLMYKNPYNPSKLCFVISGNNDSYLIRHSELNMIGDLRIMVNGSCAAMGLFKVAKNNRWVIDPNTYRNFIVEKKDYNSFKNFRYVVYSNDTNIETVRKINSYNESCLQTVRKFFGEKFSHHKIDYYLYNNFEDKGLITGNTHLGSIDTADGSVHAVVNNWINGDDFSNIAELLIRKKLGSPKIKILEEGLSVYFSHGWRNKGYKYWASLLDFSGDEPTLKELRDNNKLPNLSPLVAEPLAGTLVSFLIGKYGRESFIKQYADWNPSGRVAEVLNIEWRAYLDSLSRSFRKEIVADRKNFPRVITGFQKGFCFAHEGYQIYNGYMSHEADQSVEKMKSLGANSFSITPFTSVRVDDKPEQLRFWESAGAENDESLIHLAHLAGELKMNLILKPHIYLGRQLWPGDIKMKNKNDWSLFFKYYFEWIRHYALLAQMYKIPMQCLGNELAGATVGHEAEWIKMAERIRKLYSGKLVYGANWSNEFEKLTFWKHFDYIGISEYFPLSNDADPTDQELLKGAEDDMRKIEEVHSRYPLPVIFTEVGFRSSGEPWKTALEKSSRDSSDYENQARCYQALFEAAYDKPWLAGLYWWKWPSYLSFGRRRVENSYTPLNKPAENIIKFWYSKNWNQ